MSSNLVKTLIKKWNIKFTPLYLSKIIKDRLQYS